MRRWNGWGGESIEVRLEGEARAFLGARLGRGMAQANATFESVCAQLPPGRLPAHPLIDASAAERARHAFGQSLPDWLRLRHGRLGLAPDGVAFPESSAQVRELIDFAAGAGAAVMPYGGGTSVAGHPAAGHGSGSRWRPTLCIDMRRMRALISLDREALLACFGAGVAGPDLEAQLHAHGYTLGHYPESFDYSTLGGWIATRASGQQAQRYGRIEKLFAGGRVETPSGTLDIPTCPASVSGIDLREMVLGAEGRIGVLTHAAVRISRRPEYEAFHAVFFPDWERAVIATRALAQSRIDLSMLRLLNAGATGTMLALGGRGHQARLIERYLGWRGCGPDRCMLLIGASGAKAQAREALRAAITLARRQRGVHAGRALGEQWRRARFRSAYLRIAAWQHGYAMETVETTLDWPHITAAAGAIERAAAAALETFGERVHAYTHLSNPCPQGASVCTTVVYRLAGDYETDLARWRLLRQQVAGAIVGCGGAIAHQPNIGPGASAGHAPGQTGGDSELGAGAMGALFRHFDPDGRMMPDRLVTP